MGAYDLYGQWYENTRDAHNAEDAQCALINAQLARQKQEASEETLYSLCESQHYEVLQLQDRVAALEAKFSAPVADTTAEGGK